MTIVPFLLIIVCLILAGASIGKPVGYIICGLATLALLLQLVVPKL